MLIGALLILTWLVLLIRYPLRAVPISLGAVLGLALGLALGLVLDNMSRNFWSSSSFCNSSLRISIPYVWRTSLNAERFSKEVSC